VAAAPVIPWLRDKEMKSMNCLFILIALVFSAMTCLAEAASSDLFPAQLKKLESGRPDKYCGKVKDIPQPVLDAFQKALGGQDL
jgi:hypothetical protein